jgi:hypothetical protein
MVPMVKNSLIFLGCLCLLFSCRTVKVVGGNNYNGDVTKLKAEMDSLIQNYGNNPEACIQVLNLASYSEDYLPDSNLYRDLERLEYFYEYGNILECVGDEIKAGNRKAESVMIRYLTNYYNSIEARGSYSSSGPFEILWYTSANDDVLNLIKRLTTTEVVREKSTHYRIESKLEVLAHKLTLSRIKSINGLTSFSEVFEKSYYDYQRKLTKNGVCSIIDRWNTVVVSVLSDPNNSVEYIDDGFDHKSSFLFRFMMSHNPCSNKFRN